MAILRAMLSKQVSQYFKMKDQVEQQETLVRVRMIAENIEDSYKGRSQNCFKFVVALATVMGLLAMALAGFIIIHHFPFTSPCNQEAPPVGKPVKVSIMGKPKETDEQGRYDIFTAEKSARYLICGWLAFSRVTNEELYLIQRRGENERKIKTETLNKTNIFFFEPANLIDNTTISIRLKSTYIDGAFHVCELGER